MELNNDNYFSLEAKKEYFSVSQYNRMVGTPTKTGCEAIAIAIQNNEYIEEPTKAMLVGTYVDEYFSGDLENLKKNTPELFTNRGELRAEFVQANSIIEFIKKDNFWMKYAVGEGIPQVIVKGEIEGTKWRGKIDRLHIGTAIVDVKVVNSIREKIWSVADKCYINFIDAWGYVNQGAIYRELYYQMTGEKLDFYIAVVSKEKVPDKEVIYIPNESMDNALEAIKQNIPRLKKVKEGINPPVKCGICDYCRSLKMLEGTIYPEDLYL